MSNLHGPDPSPRPNVNDSLRAGVNRALVELVVVQNQEHLVTGGNTSVWRSARAAYDRTHFKSNPSFCFSSLGALQARQVLCSAIEPKVWRCIPVLDIFPEIVIGPAVDLSERQNTRCQDGGRGCAVNEAVSGGHLPGALDGDGLVGFQDGVAIISDVLSDGSILCVKNMTGVAKPYGDDGSSLRLGIAWVSHSSDQANVSGSNLKGKTGENARTDSGGRHAFLDSGGVVGETGGLDMRPTAATCLNCRSSQMGFPRPSSLSNVLARENARILCYTLTCRVRSIQGRGMLRKVCHESCVAEAAVLQLGTMFSVADWR